MDVITHLNSKGTTALLFIPGDLPSPLLYLPCRVSLCIDPNTGRKTIKWYPELARLQINCQLPVNAAGVAPSFSLTHSTAGSRSAVRLSAGSETALAMLLNWSVLLIQGIFLRMKPEGCNLFHLRGMLGMWPLAQVYGRKHWVFRAKPCRILAHQQKAATTSVQARKQSVRWTNKQLIQNISREGSTSWLFRNCSWTYNSTSVGPTRELQSWVRWQTCCLPTTSPHHRSSPPHRSCHPHIPTLLLASFWQPNSVFGGQVPSRVFKVRFPLVDHVNCRKKFVSR